MMMVSRCIDLIEREMIEGGLEASRFIPVPQLKGSQNLILYKMWRVDLVDKTIEEKDNNRAENYISDPTKELQDDVAYFNKVHEEERAQKLTTMTIRSISIGIHLSQLPLFDNIYSPTVSINRPKREQD